MTNGTTKYYDYDPFVQSNNRHKEEIEIDNSGDEHHEDEDHPRLQAIERLCFSYNTIGNTCYITDKNLKFTSDFKYVTQKSLVFDSSTIRCQTIRYAPCKIQFELTTPNSKIELLDGSSFQGSTLYVEIADGNLHIDERSSLYVSAQALNTNGTMSVGSGASFIGQSGSCNANVNYWRTYGEFDMVPNFSATHVTYSQIGSMGKNGDVETAGGGRIVVVADSVTLKGSGNKMEANGAPFQNFVRTTDYLQGGSGGYIYVNTTNRYQANSYDSEAMISAKGGYGMGGAYSGSGGVIVLDGFFDIPEEQVVMNGG